MITKLSQHYLQHGLCPLLKKSGGRKNNTRSVSFEQLQEVVSFISNHTDVHGLVLPGRVPGFKSSDIKLLPPASYLPQKPSSSVQHVQGSNE